MELAVDHEYVCPVREIFSNEDMPKWEQSEAYLEFTGFVSAMNKAVKGKTLSADYSGSQVTENMVAMLDKMNGWIDEIPPIEQPQRFGNKAFRDWYQRLKNESEGLLKDVLPAEFHHTIVEIVTYLVESVGNATRIDYGTGHEMAFAMFLCSLFKIGILKAEDSQSAILKVFNRYMVLMRRLQLTYRMEPAGSHGVWSLDDYQFLPFVWGSSQMIDHPRLEPKSFPNEDIVDAYAKDFMFLGCIQFINQVKTGPFHEHSNQLWNISGVPTWSKVNSGLTRMYKKEVLGKFPVVQHVLFGSIFSLKPAQAVRASAQKDTLKL